MEALTKCPKGCRYEGHWDHLSSCDYILITGHRRGCEGGENCARYTPIDGDKPKRQALPDFPQKPAVPEHWWDTARTMLLSGMMSDLAISEKLGVTDRAVRAWRHRHSLPSGRELKAERITELSAKIRAYRSESGWTREQFAARLGVPCRRLAKWEQGVAFAPEPVRKLVGCEW